MYKFKTYCSEDGLWFTNEEEIRALAADVDKAINIIVKPWEHLVPYTVWPIVVGEDPAL